MPAQGGLAAMIAQSGGTKDLIQTAQQIESAPGGAELLYTLAAEEMAKGMGATKKQAKKIRMYDAGSGAPVKAARGGSTKAAAERTRKAGRGDDSIMLHMSPDEYDVITSMWGEPEMNPNTGIGEYGFLSKAFKKLKKGVKKIVKSKVFQVVAPIALATFAPWVVPWIGTALGAGTGAAASMVGNAVIQGGLGAVAGGRKGAIRGAISGAIAGGGAGKGAGATLGRKLGMDGRLADTVGSALLEGAGAELTGDKFASGAVRGAVGAQTRPMTEALSSNIREGLGLGFQGEPIAMADAAQINPMTQEPMGMGSEAIMPKLGVKGVAAGSTYTPTTPLSDPLAAQQPGTYGTPGAPAASLAPGAPGGQGAPGKADPFKNVLEKYGLKYGLPLLLGAGAVSGGEYEDPEPPELPPEFAEKFNEPLPQYQMNRRFDPLDPASYYSYGRAGSPTSGEHLFIDPPGPFSFEQQQGMPPPGGLGQAAGGYQRGGEFDHWSQNQDVPNAAPTVSARGRYVRGGGTGRSDDIEARLSDGEYVIDAESVALLGDGSGDAGAQRLDEMRKNLRKHKGQNLKKGKFSHKAKKPANYMSKMGRLRRAAKYEHGGVMNVAGTSPPHMGATGVNV